MKLWNKIAQDARLIKMLVVVNAVQILVILGLLVCIATIPTRFTFHIPPDLSNGATLHENKIPKPYVGQFAFYIWQVVNNWQTDGREDAKKNIQQYGAYLSPGFRYELQEQDKKLQSMGELQGRVRVIRPVDFSRPQVTKLDSNSWQVLLTVRDSEYVNGILVKDKTIEYPIKVVRYNGNAQFNPFGLVLDGFMGEPQIVKTMK